MYRTSPFLRQFAFALLAGMAVATLWVNLSPDSYYDALEAHLADLALPGWVWASEVAVRPFLLVVDLLMALFVFLIGKELWEALVLRGGALHGRRAVLPLGLAGGGMLGAAAVWLALSALIETAQEAVPGGGWTVPLGTDTVLVYLVARRIFGPGHPALHLALLLAIATDLAALAVLGLDNPHLSRRILWLALPAAAAAGVHLLYGRPPPPGASERRRRAHHALWPWAVAGALSWFGTAASGLPAALGLLPLIPAVPHADRSFGLFAEAEAYLHDPLNRLAHLLQRPVMAVLFLTGLVLGAVDLQAFAPTTLVTLGSLWIGRPAGMLAAGLVLAGAFGLARPAGIARRDLVLIGVMMAMGFTIPAVALTAALPGGAMNEAARLGLALSLLAGPLALGLARIWPGRG